MTPGTRRDNAWLAVTVVSDVELGQQEKYRVDGNIHVDMYQVPMMKVE